MQPGAALEERADQIASDIPDLPDGAEIVPYAVEGDERLFLGRVETPACEAAGNCRTFLFQKQVNGAWRTVFDYPAAAVQFTPEAIGLPDSQVQFRKGGGPTQHTVWSQSRGSYHYINETAPKW